MSNIFSTLKNEFVNSANLFIFSSTTESANLFPTINSASLKSHFNSFSINGSVIEYGNADIILSHSYIYIKKLYFLITYFCVL